MSRRPAIAIAVVLVGASAVAFFATRSAPPQAVDDPAPREDPPAPEAKRPEVKVPLTELWTFKVGVAVEGAPVVVGGTVYISSLDKHLYALDLATGKEKWRTKLGALKAGPVVKGDRAYIGNLDGTFFCVSLDKGNVLWKFETTGEIRASASFHGDNVLVVSCDAVLYCLGPTGQKVWEAKTEGPVHGSPAVAGDTVLVAGCGSILQVIDVKTGKELGRVHLGAEVASTASARGDFVYVGTMGGQVVALDRTKLAREWTYDAPKRPEFYSSVVVTDDLVVVGGRDRNVYGLDRATGKRVWYFTTEGEVDGTPAVVGGRVFVGCLGSDGNFYVLDLKTGKKLHELELAAPVCGSVGVGPDCVLVGTDKGTVYCFKVE